jgi:hypothetical protein
VSYISKLLHILIRRLWIRVCKRQRFGLSGEQVIKVAIYKGIDPALRTLERSLVEDVPGRDCGHQRWPPDRHGVALVHVKT